MGTRIILVLVAALAVATTAVGVPTARPTAARAAVPTGAQVHLAGTVSTTDIRHRVRGAIWLSLEPGVFEIGDDDTNVPVLVASYGNAARSIKVLDAMFGAPRVRDYDADPEQDPDCAPSGTSYRWGVSGRNGTAAIELDDDDDDLTNPLGDDYRITVSTTHIEATTGHRITLMGPTGEEVGQDVSAEVDSLDPGMTTAVADDAAEPAMVAMLETGWGGSVVDRQTNGAIPDMEGVTAVVLVGGGTLVSLSAPDSLHGSAECPRNDTQSDAPSAATTG